MSPDARSNCLALLLLNQVSFLSKEEFLNLIKVFKEPASIIAPQNERSLASVSQIGSRLASALKKIGKIFNSEKELERCEREGIRLVNILEDIYPVNLREIYDPPLVLYVKGDVSSFHKAAVAIVGSRLSSIYGEEVARRFSSKLAGWGLTVVSGLARGIDSAAHRGALEIKGRTVAVLGSGIDVVYPKENRALFDEVAGRGALVSEFPLTTPPLKQNFPRRNRVISGLSLGVLVVEAHEKSGSLITVRSAIEQGREVYAVPGKLNAPMSRGTNQLLKDGAKLALEPEDILSDLEPQLKGLVKEPGALDNKGEESPIRLGDKERKILSLLKEESLSADDIVERLALGAHEVLSILTSLEIKGCVKKRSGVFSYVRG
ncbi:MAG: DNA-processing protein DprA [Candidatus Omnitrophica bacterium]|nr:DNA-processing protein DprA [Candidatus Omnitrophota bacterium]